MIEEVELDHSPIPSGCRRRLDEVTIRRDGQVWRIYKNDSDPFPSNPHAHNIESGLKLDLSNGRLYYRNTDTGKSISKRDLLAIRAQMKNIAPPPLVI
ncbi:MAG TPA: hypothetical protein PLX18_08290 [Anaerohalosphaeraceae bacterium]|nr:hypothetical protein [Anaerohalosphaeraceae bacterium]HQG05016.1 hypothetical protein [Anaerohalosphaeraceae bacterium]HQI07841.1 hypothetical protein [Anaerohalosphaeraceae bacterium]HQJ68202.1 hypothetical protein [Anaerohalosphaeraceae bacterium]